MAGIKIKKLKTDSLSYLIKGGVPLSGTVKLSGAKNSASKLIIASLLTDQPVHISNCPISTGDIIITKEICETLGSHFKKFEDNEVIIQTKSLSANTFSASLGVTNRIGVLTAGPLLSRVREAIIPKPGGDRIGKRPIDFHLSALVKLGAKVKEYKNFFEIKTSSLKGSNIQLPYPSVGATENIIMTACLAEGTTYLFNAAVEPEVIDLIKLLQKMGAVIDIMTDRKIVVRGVEKLNGARHKVIPDRLEAASIACCAIASKGDVTIQDAQQEDMISFLNSVRMLGADYEILDDGIRFFYKDKLKPIAIETNVHPGFMTDWQPPFTILLTQAEGVSIIHETVYENRFGYVAELKKMGANIELYNSCLGSSLCRFLNTNYFHSAVINGPSKLRADVITVPDIRAGFSYLIAALIAEGESKVRGVRHIERGYENIDLKLKQIGADITRIA